MSAKVKSKVVLALVLVAALALVWQMSRSAGEDPVKRAPREASGRPAPGPGGDGASRTTPSAAESDAAAGRAVAAGAERDGEPAPVARLGVRVLHRGEPVEGAVLLLIRGGDVVDSGDGSDAQGRFEFKIYEVGEFTLRAIHSSYAPAQVPVEIAEGDDSQLVIEMPASEWIDVSVHDAATGAPVAGARVIVLRAGWGGAFEGQNEALEEVMDVFSFGEGGQAPDLSVFSVVEIPDLMLLDRPPAARSAVVSTDAAGKARVVGLPPGRVELIVLHTEYIPTRLKRVPVSGDVIEVKLGLGGGLTVIAPLFEGRVAEGFVCIVQRPGFFPLPIAAQRVPAEGGIVFSHLPPGTYSVSVSRQGGALFLSSVLDEGEEEEEQEDVNLGTRTIRIAAGEMKILDMSGIRGATVQGRLLMGGEPVEGGMVVLLTGENFERQVAMSMELQEGRFSFPNVAPGRYRLSAMSPAESAARREFEVKAGAATVEVDIEFGTAAVEGRVRDADGKPVADASIFLMPLREKPVEALTGVADFMELMAGNTDSDEEGRFEVSGLDAGRYLLVCARSGRLDEVEIELREGERRVVEMAFDPSRQRTLLVFLRDAEGQPVPGSVTIETDSGGILQMMAMFLNDEGGALLLGRETRAEHSFALPPGDYLVSVTAAGYADLRRRRIDLSSDRTLDVRLLRGVELTLTFVRGGAPLAGESIDVRDEAGRRVGRGSSPMELLLGSDPPRTDGEGVLRLEHLLPGRYTVHWNKKEIGRVRVGGEPVQRRLRVD